MTVLLFLSKIKNVIFQEKVGNLMDLPLGNLPGPRQKDELKLFTLLIMMKFLLLQFMCFMVNGIRGDYEYNI